MAEGFETPRTPGVIGSAATGAASGSAGPAAAAGVPLLADEAHHDGVARTDSGFAPGAAAHHLGPRRRDNPHSSASAALRKLMADFGELARNRNFLLLMTTFGIGLGMFNAFLTLAAQYIRPCGYDDTVAGITGGALLGAGLVGAVLVGLVLEKTRAYVQVLKIGIVLAIAAVTFMLTSMRPGATAVLVVSYAVMGFCLVPLLPVSLETAAECTYPIPEDNSAAALLISGQLWGIAFIFALTPAIQLPPSASCSTIITPAAGIIFFSVLLAGLVLIGFRKDYRRAKADAERSAAAAAIAVVDATDAAPADIGGAIAAAPRGSLNGSAALR